MDKLEVDPKLFITCRLCLEEMGQYQIVPSVQQQINFCFDITVDPFDGLPQLICRGCELILTQFNTIKKKYQEKQNDLKSNMKGCIINASASQQQNIVTSTEPTESQLDAKNEITNSKSFKLTLKKKQNNCSEAESCGSSYSIVKKPVPARSIKPSKKWRKKYDKYFICRYCSNAYKEKKSDKHVEKHRNLLAKYSNLIKNCSIIIPRIDQKKNLTGLDNTVVMNHENIIQKFNANYTILYKRRASCHSDNENIRSPETSDDSIMSVRKRKRLRLVSESSNETVVLEGSTKKEDDIEPPQSDELKATVIECVDIDDSSESDNNVNETYLNTNMEANEILKTKIISQNITACYNKFINKSDSSVNYKCNKDNLLQHKILSMGRKVISKKRFNCIGLLRYLENKHLPVHWNNKKLEFVYVRTKLKENVKNDDDIGWKSISKVTDVQENISLNSLLEKIHTFDTHFSICNKAPSSSKTSATLTLQMQNDNNYILKKLLNPNPVANPKQLPKKTNLLDNHCVKVISGQASSINNETNVLHSMPIITSTISLAELNNEDAQNSTQKVVEDSNTDASTSQPFVPRIKVKPVSQLMPENSSKNIAINVGHVTPNNWTVPQPANVSPALPDPQYSFNVPITTQQTPCKENIQRNENVIMHTVEIPNHVTPSPFLYFKNLLQVHNFILMNSNDIITTDLSCLIKFKSKFNQDNRMGVTLCMALFSDGKYFCIKVKDKSSEIDIKSFPAHWQWEILQLFKGEIAERLLENAKKICKKLHDSTSYFVSLLRSIVFRKT